MGVEEAIRDAVAVGVASHAGTVFGAAGGPVGALIGGAVGGAVGGAGVAVMHELAGDGLGWDDWDEIAWGAGGGALAGVLGGAVGALRLLGAGRTVAAAAAEAGSKPTLQAILSQAPRGLEGIEKLGLPIIRSLVIQGGPSVAAYAFVPHGPGRPPSLPTTRVGQTAFAGATPPIRAGWLEMPDQDERERRDYPDAYNYSRNLQAYYEGTPRPGLPETVVAFWDSFGDPDRVEAIPASTSIPDVTDLPSQQSRFVNAVRQKTTHLRTTYDAFQEIHQLVVESTQEAARISSQGKDAINTLIGTINNNAGQVPGDSLCETEHIMNYVDTALTGGRQALERAASGQRQLADGVRNAAQRMADEGRRLEEAERRVKTLEDNAMLREQQRRLSDLDRDRNSSASGDRSASRDRSASTGLEEMLKQLQWQQMTQQLNRTQAAQVPPIPAPQAAATPNVAAPALGGLESMLSPLLLSSALTGRGGLDAGRNDDRLRDERDALRAERERLERERLRDGLERRDGNLAPSPVAAAAANPAPPPPPPRLDAAGAPFAQSAKAGAPAQGAGAERIPDEDGLVPYTFEDGRQQRVPPVVAQALDVALADNAGTNAQAAYENTPAKWTDEKEIGTRIDPNHLMTGDICAFENATAIAVVWGSPDSGGTLEMAVDGKLVPFDPESKEFEALGPFRGFFHPNIDQGAPGGGVKGVAATPPVADEQLAAVPG